MLKAVIFDFDGIIVDTEPIHYRAFQEILVPLGMAYSWNDYITHYMGFDDREAFAEVYKSNGQLISEEKLLHLTEAEIVKANGTQQKILKVFR